MNSYIVYGRRYVDMCGNYDDIQLGIVELEDRAEILKLARPEIGHHIYNGQYYADILFFKIKRIPLNNLLAFYDHKNGMSNLAPIVNKVK